MFISHDLSVVSHIADEIMVMYLGMGVEQGPRQAIFERPRHPYTQALLSATPRAEPGVKRRRIHLQGEIPSPIDPPGGCPFHPRCSQATDLCAETAPLPESAGPGHVVACHHWDA